MKLELPNLPIGTRVMMALAVPIAGLVALALWVLASHWRTANDMRDLREMAVLATSVSALVHELQKERGVSAGFLGSSSTAFSTRLPTQNESTDQKRVRLLRALKRIDPRRIDQKFGSSLRMRMAAAQERMGRIDEWRGSVANHAVETDVLTSDYAEAIESLIDIVKEMLLVSPNADLTRAIYAYTHFMAPSA